MEAALRPPQTAPRRPVSLDSPHLIRGAGAHIGRRDVAFLSQCLAFVSRLLFAARAPNRTACEMPRFYSARVEIAISTFSNPRAVIKLCRFTSGMSVSLWRSRRSTKGRRDAGNGVGGAAQLRFAQSHWPCHAFRGEYAGAARPRLRQRVFDSLDSLHAAAGLRWCRFAASSVSGHCPPASPSAWPSPDPCRPWSARRRECCRRRR